MSQTEPCTGPIMQRLIALAPIEKKSCKFLAYGPRKPHRAHSSESELRCSPSFGPKFSLLKVDRCLQYIIDRSLLLGLWEL